MPAASRPGSRAIAECARHMKDGSNCCCCRNDVDFASRFSCVSRMTGVPVVGSTGREGVSWASVRRVSGQQMSVCVLGTLGGGLFVA